ncbi:MAG: hypothetical protein Q9227_002544 [Pyrenula ochraceoflavens]
MNAVRVKRADGQTTNNEHNIKKMLVETKDVAEKLKYQLGPRSESEAERTQIKSTESSLSGPQNDVADHVGQLKQLHNNSVELLQSHEKPTELEYFKAQPVSNSETATSIPSYHEYVETLKDLEDVLEFPPYASTSAKALEQILNNVADPRTTCELMEYVQRLEYNQTTLTTAILPVWYRTIEDLQAHLKPALSKATQYEEAIRLIRDIHQDFRQQEGKYQEKERAYRKEIAALKGKHLEAWRKYQELPTLQEEIRALRLEKSDLEYDLELLGKPRNSILEDEARRRNATVDSLRARLEEYHETMAASKRFKNYKKLQALEQTVEEMTTEASEKEKVIEILENEVNEKENLFLVLEDGTRLSAADAKSLIMRQMEEIADLNGLEAAFRREIERLCAQKTRLEKIPSRLLENCLEIRDNALRSSTGQGGKQNNQIASRSDRRSLEDVHLKKLGALTAVKD